MEWTRAWLVTPKTNNNSNHSSSTSTPTALTHYSTVWYRRTTASADSLQGQGPDQPSYWQQVVKLKSLRRPIESASREAAAVGQRDGQTTTFCSMSLSLQRGADQKCAGRDTGRDRVVPVHGSERRGWNGSGHRKAGGSCGCSGSSHGSNRSDSAVAVPPHAPPPQRSHKRRMDDKGETPDQPSVSPR